MNGTDLNGSFKTLGGQKFTIYRRKKHWITGLIHNPCCCAFRPDWTTWFPVSVPFSQYGLWKTLKGLLVHSWELFYQPLPFILPLSRDCSCFLFGAHLIGPMSICICSQGQAMFGSESWHHFSFGSNFNSPRWNSLKVFILFPGEILKIKSWQKRYCWF